MLCQALSMLVVAHPLVRAGGGGAGREGLVVADGGARLIRAWGGGRSAQPGGSGGCEGSQKTQGCRKDRVVLLSQS